MKAGLRCLANARSIETMPLATQCPHCSTSFRVAHDQLKLRAGLVRCGACKQIFNGIENLLHSDDPVVAGTDSELAPPVPEPTPSGPAKEDLAPASPEAQEVSQTESLDTSPDPDDVWWKLEPSADEALAAPQNLVLAKPVVAPERVYLPEADSIPEDPLLRMTLMDFSEREPFAGAALPCSDALAQDPIEQAIADLERMPLRGTKRASAREEQASYAEIGEDAEIDDSEAEEPSFVHQGRRRKRLRRVLSLTMLGCSVLMLIALIAQGTYVFRDQLAARFPQAKPVLLQACTALGCQLGLPAQIDTVSIESSELQSLAPNSNRFGLTVLLRNHSTIEQAWPHIELTLNDPGEKPLARRAFAPMEYLPAVAAVREGFRNQSEQSVRLFFELDDLKASGYRIYLFYP
jgi:predicted Zn finger-like uncharacterized protein